MQQVKLLIKQLMASKDGTDQFVFICEKAPLPPPHGGVVFTFIFGNIHSYPANIPGKVYPNRLYSMYQCFMPVLGLLTR